MIALILLGAGLAALVLGLAALGGLHRERAFYATLLAAIAVFYPVFAAERGGPPDIAWQFAFAAPFIAAAILGFQTKRLFIALGLALHGLFDLVMHQGAGPAPDWWAGLCLGFDGVMAIAVLALAPGREANTKR